MYSPSAAEESGIFLSTDSFVKIASEAGFGAFTLFIPTLRRSDLTNIDPSSSSFCNSSSNMLVRSSNIPSCSNFILFGK
jgi:hypothetical protein